MRKTLLGTSALIAAGVLAAPAEAQLNLTISGYYRFDAAYVDESGDGQPAGVTAPITTRDYDFSSRVRLAFDASGTADNGLRYGARVRFLNAGGTANNVSQYDQAYGFVQSAFGRVAFGDIESAGSLLRIYAPDTAGSGIANGTWNNFTRGITNFTQRLPGGNTPPVTITAPLAVPAATTTPAPGFGAFRLDRFGTNGAIWDDVLNGSTASPSYSTKLVYTTTGIDLYGVTFGFSYAPEMGNRGRNYDRNATSGSANFEDAISVALQYLNNDVYSGIGFRAAGQYNHANSRNLNVEDLETWMIGAQLSYAGFTLGGHYIDNGDTGSVTEAGVGAGPGFFGTGIRFDNYRGWGVGAEYAVGPWTVGINYFTQWIDGIRGEAIPTAAGSPISEYQLAAYGAGASYVLAPGLTVGADVVHYEEDLTKRNPAVIENDGTVVSVRTQVTF